MNQEGEGGSVNYAEAKRLFEYAAQRNEPFAHYSLGRMYKEGQGIAEREKEGEQEEEEREQKKRKE